MLYLQWPQVIWIALVLLGLGIHIAKNGEINPTTYSAWRQLFHIVLTAALLSWGGFFSPAHAQVPADAARYRAELTRAAHSQWGLNAPVAVLAAQVHQESSWNPQAVSRVGARGLAQFMPGTTAWWCERARTKAADCLPNNPTWALRALVGYDRYLYDLTPARFSERDRMWVALRGYNGGLGHWRAEEKIAEARLRQAELLLQAERGDAHPNREAIDAACGRARRHISHCPENLGYPHRIMTVLQPRYASWGPGL